MRVLIVEDDRDNAQLIKSLLGYCGHELASKLRDEAGLTNARILAISGYPENPALNEASGIHGHLLKPIELATLQKLLESG